MTHEEIEKRIAEIYAQLTPENKAKARAYYYELLAEQNKAEGKA